MALLSVIRFRKNKISSRRFLTSGISRPFAPASKVKLEMCNFMCPSMKPNVVNARIAPRFCTKPTAATIRASSSALVTFKIFKQIFAVGCKRVTPPMMPSIMGASK